jgi:hypothetical protein
MKLLIALFFILFFPLFIFLTTILSTPDITPLIKTDLIKTNMYSNMSNQLSKLDIGDSNSALVNQFIQNRFTASYIQQKVEKAMDSSDAWIRGKTTKPPVISFTDVIDELTTQYPQLLPSIEQAASEMKQKEEQNPALQQNPQATKNLDMIASLAKSNFTIPLNKYLIGLKNFYKTIRILQPILALLLILCVILLGTMNKNWPQRLKWIGFTMLLASIWGFILAYSNDALVSLLAKYATTISNHTMQIAFPIIFQIIKQYVDAFTAYQKVASIISLAGAVICFVFSVVIRNSTVLQTKPRKNKNI